MSQAFPSRQRRRELFESSPWLPGWRSGTGVYLFSREAGPGWQDAFSATPPVTSSLPSAARAQTPSSSAPFLRSKSFDRFTGAANNVARERASREQENFLDGKSCGTADGADSRGRGFGSIGQAALCGQVGGCACAMATARGLVSGQHDSDTPVCFDCTYQS